MLKHLTGDIKMKNKSNCYENNIGKDELCEIIDGLFLQVVWIKLCLDELDALKEIGNDKIKIAKHFFYIAHSSLIYRYSMELAKLFDIEKGLSIYRISNLCGANKEYFDNTFDIIQYCRDFRKELKKYNKLIDNIRGRRMKTYAHNDKDYYLFNKKAIIEFPIDLEEVKNLADILYIFAHTMQEKINSTRQNYGYLSNTDDVKHLFGMKTKDEIWLDEVDEDFRPKAR